MHMITSMADRIMAHVVPVPFAGCWLWDGRIANNGYGNVGAHTLAHRAAYEAFVGPIPVGLCVLHKCDVRSCVNPAHLFIGDQGDNARDCARKGRKPIGSRHALAKLTEEQVRELRLSKDYSAKSARRLGVSRMALYRVRDGETWTHVQSAAPEVSDGVQARNEPDILGASESGSHR